MFFSIIIPLYNRPQEIDELLESLTRQSYTHFEVLVVEDGSVNEARSIVSKYENRIDVKYFYKENEGQGFTRNFGFERAKGDYFIVFESDCIIPPQYLEKVLQSLNNDWLDAFGGPDAAHGSFTNIQKAISYSMTSVFTTGGIRGAKKHIGQFHPRSFNMGISRKVWETVGGFLITRMGEDIEYSIRIHEAGFKIGLIPEAFVYHKRRTDLIQFFKQLHFFGRARINIYTFFPAELKLVHFFPLCFFMGLLLGILLLLFSETLAIGILVLYGLYFSLIFCDSLFKNKSLGVAFLSIFAALTQLSAYGIGFAKEAVGRLLFKKISTK